MSPIETGAGNNVPTSGRYSPHRPKNCTTGGGINTHVVEVADTVVVRADPTSAAAR
jgi:hypothetical protein